MKKRILIIDDSLLARMAVRNCIPTADNYEVFEASDGASGIEKFKETTPHLTFLDLTMPVMDGFKALEEIRRINERALVIILTADIQTKTCERVLSLGAFAVLKKPPIRNEIMDAIKKAEQKMVIDDESR